MTDHQHKTNGTSPSQGAEVARRAEAKTLYIHRPVVNAAEVIAWAKGQGFQTTLPENDLHVTIAFSRATLDWAEIPAAVKSVIIAGGERSLKQFGLGAVVLTLESPTLASRWAELIGLGASWDHPEYRPHVTLTYEPGDLDLSAVIPFEGEIVLGPEVFAEVKEDWKSGIREKADGSGTVVQLVAIKKVDDDKRVVYGEVYAPYVLDSHGEFMLPEDIELMAHRFMKLELGTSIDTQHDNVPNGSYPIESFIARDGDPDYTPGAWVLGVKVPDDNIWRMVKSGILNGFSFQGLVKAKEMEVEYTVVRDHVGMTEAHGDHAHVYFLELDEMGRVVRGHTDTVNGHSHEIVRASVTSAAAGHTHRFFL